MIKALALATLLAAAAGQAHAQAASAAAPPSASKKAAVTKVLQLIEPGVEDMARQLVLQPAVQMQQQLGVALQRVPAERREALAHDIDADLRKYAEEATPIAREHAAKLAPATIGPLLDERFSEDELRQLGALLESPAYRKFQQMFPDMQRAFGEKLVGETRGEIETKVRALNEAVAKRLGIAAAGAAASAASAPAK